MKWGVVKAGERKSMKWTDKMVKLLIIAVSYMGEDALLYCSSGGGRKNLVILHKKGKLRLYLRLWLREVIINHLSNVMISLMI